jgi:hypothetical protein
VWPRWACVGRGIWRVRWVPGADPCGWRAHRRTAISSCRRTTRQSWQGCASVCSASRRRCSGSWTMSRPWPSCERRRPARAPHVLMYSCCQHCLLLLGESWRPRAQCMRRWTHTTAPPWPHPPKHSRHPITPPNGPAPVAPSHTPVARVCRTHPRLPSWPAAKALKVCPPPTPTARHLG